MTTVVFALLGAAWLAYMLVVLATRGSERIPDAEAVTTDQSVIIKDATAARPTYEVSTPESRRARLAELNRTRTDAARRRRIALFVLLGAVTGLAVGWALRALPWWAPVVPAGMIVVFLAIARFSVVAMQRRLDAIAEQITSGWEEETDSIALPVDESTMGRTEAVLAWDSIPVTAPTYVSKPLVPRSVRTIDLSAPAPAHADIVPSADPLEDAEGRDEAAAQAQAEETIEGRPGVQTATGEQSPWLRAVGD